MSNTSTPNIYNESLDIPYEEISLNDMTNRSSSADTMQSGLAPKSSTLRLLKQFARCYVSTSGIAIPALSAMVAN